jgi:hypothetical protein
MFRRDIDHDTVKRALQKAGCTISYFYNIYLFLKKRDRTPK